MLAFITNLTPLNNTIERIILRVTGETKYLQQCPWLSHPMINHACKMIYKNSANRWIYFNITKYNFNKENCLGRYSKQIMSAGCFFSYVVFHHFITNKNTFHKRKTYSFSIPYLERHNLKRPCHHLNNIMLYLVIDAGYESCDIAEKNT